jgi:hypothetical protein
MPFCKEAFMRIQWKTPGDWDEVVARIGKAVKQRKATQRDRLRVVLLAGDGDESGRESFREQIAWRTGRSR